MVHWNMVIWKVRLESTFQFWPNNSDQEVPTDVPNYHKNILVKQKKNSIQLLIDKPGDQNFPPLF